MYLRGSITVSFNLGIKNYPGGYFGGIGFGAIGVYLYENIFYRRWITEIALAFYEGRQDEFVWLDLLKQFRNPEKQQILPLNLTREIIDETSILYRESPIYKVVDEDGKALPKDQKLWEEIQKSSRYLQLMDKIDRWCRLLGTILVKVSFINEKGELVEETDEGSVRLDVLHGGVYDVKYIDSPYYISELLIGFGHGFSGFTDGSTGIGNPRNSGLSQAMGLKPDSAGRQKVTTIYWSLEDHRVSEIGEKGEEKINYEGENPYGIVPAVPFFNQEPAHYYFLPVNEPLLYANHAINMRLTDLNHIAKFQSFGIPVITGVERGTSIRRGRPVDDFNMFRAGSATRSHAGAFSRLGSGLPYRSFDSAFNFLADGNADANSVGMSIGPDTAIAVGEKGDFKFAHPQADIQGLAKTIQQLQDWIRVNHGLMPKGASDKPSQDSGFSKMMTKIGVIEENIRRQKVFMEREKQLFQVIKKLWNVHYAEKGASQFSEDAVIQITYVEPNFPVDPLTKINLLEGQMKIIQSGDTRAIKEMFPYMDDAQIEELLQKHHDDRVAQAEREAELFDSAASTMKKHGVMPDGKSLIPTAGGADKAVSGKDNKFKDSEEKSKQKGKNMDTRPQKKEERAAKPQGKSK